MSIELTESKTTRKCVLKRKAANLERPQSDDCEETDPYDTDDNDKDYVPEKKKKNSEQVIPKRRLTPKERIERLKSKMNVGILKKNISIPNSSDTIPSQSSKLETVDDDQQHVINLDTNYNHFFSEENSDSCEKMRTDENSSPIPILQVETCGTFPAQQQPACTENSSTVHLMIKVLAHLKDIQHDVFALRKQVARIEAKSIGLTQQLSKSSNGSCEWDDGEEIVMDFEASLAREGLPLKTLTAVDNLEEKLSQNPDYKTKLVKIFAYSSLFLFC